MTYTITKFSSKGGKARARKLSARRRRDIAVRAISIRWARAKLAQEVTT